MGFAHQPASGEGETVISSRFLLLCLLFVLYLSLTFSLSITHFLFSFYCIFRVLPHLLLAFLFLTVFSCFILFSFIYSLLSCSSRLFFRLTFIFLSPFLYFSLHFTSSPPLTPHPLFLFILSFLVLNVIMFIFLSSSSSTSLPQSSSFLISPTVLLPPSRFQYSYHHHCSCFSVSTTQK